MFADEMMKNLHANPDINNHNLKVMPQLLVEHESAIKFLLHTNDFYYYEHEYCI